VRAVLGQQLVGATSWADLLPVNNLALEAGRRVAMPEKTAVMHGAEAIALNELAALGDLTDLPLP
jgi:hypothetical protein